MFIADSQVHIWAPNSPERPWSRRPHRAEPFSADQLLKEMDAAGVARAVLAPPGFDGARNDLVLAAAQAHPDRFCCVGALDIHAPEAPRIVETWQNNPGMRGLRLNFARDLAPSLEGQQLDWLWKSAEKAGAPIMILVPHLKLQLLDRIAKSHPALKFSLVHMGLETGSKDETSFRHVDRLLDMARNPNVCINASALPLYTDDPYPHRALHAHLKNIFAAFGPKRVFWGTDFTRLRCTYREAVSMFADEMPWLSKEDKTWIMGRALCEWLEWQI